MTLVGLGAIIFGYTFLKGKNIFNNDNMIYANFKVLGPLEKSNLVKINGVTVGSVYAIEPGDANINSVKVTLAIKKGINIPSNSIAYQGSSALGLAGTFMVIEKGNAASFLKSGDTIATTPSPDILAELSGKIGPTLNTVNQTLDSLKQVFSNVNSIINDQAKNNIHAILANVQNASTSLNKTIQDLQSPLNKSLGNLGAFTETLKNNKDSLTAIISSFKTTSEKLSAVDINSITNSIESTLNNFKSLLNKVSSTDGTLGALMNDKTIYNQIRNVVLSTEILLDDLRTHPKRYVNISLFGKKDKGGALNAPLIKDTIPVEPEK